MFLTASCDRYLKQKSARQEAQMQQLISTESSDSKTNFLFARKPDSRSSRSALACTTEKLNITCPDNTHIFTTSGVYAQFAHPCESGATCCPPNPIFDCTENIEENAPQDWMAVKTLCDNKTSCVFENPGSAIHECNLDLSEYMLIYYDCLNDDETKDEPAAFTAIAVAGEQDCYSQDQIVVYGLVLSNFGGHYNPETSTFVCPVNGVYLVSVTLQSTSIDDFAVDLMRNANVLARAWGDEVHGTELHSSASCSVITECNRGDLLWVKAFMCGYMDAVDRHNVFTAHLVNRL